MKYSLDASNFYLAAASSICSYVPSISTRPLLSNDTHHRHPPWWSVSFTVVKASSTRSMFSFCYDMLDSPLSCIHISLFFLCIVLLPRPMSPPLLYLLVSYPPCIILPAFLNVFPTLSGLSLLPRRIYIGFPSVLLILPFSHSPSIKTYQGIK